MTQTRVKEKQHGRETEGEITSQTDKEARREEEFKHLTAINVAVSIK